MRVRLPIVLASTLLSLAFLAGPVLAAPALLPPLAAPRVVLAFGARYGQAASVHRGLDLAGAAGDPVRAPVSGTVSFAGRLPTDAGDAYGVTVTAEDGTKVTCLPLESLGVAKGDRVEAGAALGSLAAAGDASSPGPHVHLSLRQGELYLDPAPRLASTSSPVAEPPAKPAAAAARKPSLRVSAPAVVPAAPAPSPVSRGLAAHAAPAASPVPVPCRMSSFSAAAVVSHAAAGVHALGLRTPLRPASPPPVSLPDLSPLTARVRSATIALGALMVAAALIAPAWRRPAIAPRGEAVPVRSEA
ncbi:MAG TPA: M23 family metallopeptidase [Coriobacteriia bacterium]|jgi:hypothetical protein